MDKVAIISDIHGNMPALEAVLDDIASRNIKRIYCLGDLVGKGPQPTEVIDRVLQVCEVVVFGNWDLGITMELAPDDLNRWHKERIGAERLNILKELPFSYDFYMSGRLIRLFHASPQSVFKRIQPWHPIEDRLAMFENTSLTGTPLGNVQPDVVGYGDIHNAFIQYFHNKTLFNVGSVGNPLDLNQASYVIMEGYYDERKLLPFSIHFARIPYDIERAVELAERSGMPFVEPYVYELRTAIYRGLRSKQQS